MRALGIDYGSKNVGIAISDETKKFALPHSIIPNDGQLIKKIAELCRENAISEIIIGESKNFKGEPNEIMKKILPFKEILEKKTGLPIFLEPEFMTSAEAERVLFRRVDRDADRTGVRPNRKVVKNEKLDASAAALILKSYLDKNFK